MTGFYAEPVVQAIPPDAKNASPKLEFWNRIAPLKRTNRMAKHIVSRSGAAALLCLFLLLSAACSREQTPPPEAVRLALIAQLTGEYADIGAVTRDAVELACARINAQGGVMTREGRKPLNLVVIDKGASVEGGLEALRRAVFQERASLVIGGFLSRDAIPMARVADELRTPFITPGSTHPETTRGKRFVWRMPFTDAFQGRVLAQFARKDLQSRRAAVLYDSAGDYNRFLAESFRQAYQEMGGTITAFEPYVTGDSSWTAQLTHIAQSKPDVLFLPNYHNEVPLQAHQARALGVTATLIGGDGWEMLSGPGLEPMDNSFFSSTWAPEMESPASRDFVAGYEAAYRRTPNSTACLAYDAVLLAAQALAQAADTSPAAVRRALAEVETLDGAGGVYLYRGGGDPEKSAAILRIANGRAVFYKEMTPGE
jgi:branched-chain amino acid transport system substrate-binding protein